MPGQASGRDSRMQVRPGGNPAGIVYEYEDRRLVVESTMSIKLGFVVSEFNRDITYMMEVEAR